MARPSPVAAMPARLSTPLMSTRCAGRARRIASSGIRLWPPASTLASSPCSARSASDLVDGARRVVLERRRLHAGTVPRSSRIREGGRCCSRTWTPSGASASSMALVMHAGATIIPPSPTPRKFTSGSVEHRLDVVDLEVGHVHRRRHQVVHERGGEELAVLAVGGVLEEHRPDRPAPRRRGSGPRRWPG